jgi:hypothetical protein
MKLIFAGLSGYSKISNVQNFTYFISHEKHFNNPINSVSNSRNNLHAVCIRCHGFTYLGVFQ